VTSCVRRTREETSYDDIISLYHHGYLKDFLQGGEGNLGTIAQVFFLLHVDNHLTGVGLREDGSILC